MRQFLLRLIRPEHVHAVSPADQEPNIPEGISLSVKESQDVSCAQDADSGHEVKDGYLQYLENGLPVFLDLKEGETTVGRSNNADCSLDSELVQGKHAKFSRSQGKEGTEYIIYDTSSGAGTYVNGERIPDNGWKRLTPGSEIRLADVRMTFMRRPTAELKEQLGSLNWVK